MTRFHERLSPGPGTIAAVLLVAPAVFVVLLPVAPVALAAAAALAATVAAEVALLRSAPVVAVADGELRAGRAHVPVALTGPVEGFRGAAATAARGTDLDARAWTLLRGWVDPVVRIAIVDQDDPAPYWVVSTRRPEELAAALAAARAAGDTGRDATGPAT